MKQSPPTLPPRRRTSPARVFALALAAILLFGAAFTASAVSAEPVLPTIVRWVIAGGGGAAQQAAPPAINQAEGPEPAPAAAPLISIESTLGQPVTGASFTGDLTLAAGFWGSAAAEPSLHRVLLPVITR